MCSCRNTDETLGRVWENIPGYVSPAYSGGGVSVINLGSSQPEVYGDGGGWVGASDNPSSPVGTVQAVTAIPATVVQGTATPPATPQPAQSQPETILGLEPRTALAIGLGIAGVLLITSNSK